MAKVAVKRSSLLLDTFTGSGNLDAHTAEVMPAGGAWSTKRGTFTLPGDGTVQPAVVGHSVALCSVPLGAALEITARLTPSGNGETGIVFHSNADGTNRLIWLADVNSGEYQLRKYTTLTSYEAEGAGIACPVPEGDHEYRLRVFDRTVRLFVDGVEKLALRAESYPTNVYAGIGLWSASAPGPISNLQIRAESNWKKITFLGDSITNTTDYALWRPDAPWQGYDDTIYEKWHRRVGHTYNGGKTQLVKWGFAGQSIIGHMATQAANAANDDADYIIIMLGMNDQNDAGIVQVYQDALVALGTSNPRATIYCMTILNRDNMQIGVITDAVRNLNNPRITTAVNNAIALGVNAVLWDVEGWIYPADDQWDGVHPNDTGTAKIVAQVLARLP